MDSLTSLWSILPVSPPNSWGKISLGTSSCRSFRVSWNLMLFCNQARSKIENVVFHLLTLKSAERKGVRRAKNIWKNLGARQM